MPVFAFRKQRFDPDTAFAIRLLVGFCCVVGSDAIEILLIDTATETAPLLARGTFDFEWTVIAVPGIGAIAA
jgi:hypothetical protein